MRLPSSVLVATLLVACGPRFTATALRPITNTDYRIGERRTAGIGEPIFELRSALVVPAFRITSDHTPPDDDLPTLPAGTRFVASGTDDATGDLRLSSPDFSDLYHLVASPEGVLRPGVYADFGASRGTVKTDVVWPEGLLVEDDVIEDPESGFRAQLLYLGMEGSVVRTTYREVFDAPMTDAFSRELRFDLARDSVLVYRSIRIRVLSADDRAVEYAVLEDGRLPWLPVGGG